MLDTYGGLLARSREAQCIHGAHFPLYLSVDGDRGAPKKRQFLDQLNRHVCSVDQNHVGAFTAGRVLDHLDARRRR